MASMYYSAYIILVCTFFHVESKPPLEALGGFDEAFSVGKNPRLHLSPVRGQVAIESSLLKNYYYYGDPENPVTQLINTLFFSDNTQEFDVTMLSPFKGFSPKIIAVLVATLEKYNFSENGVQDKILNKLKMAGFKSSYRRKMKPFLTLLANAQYNENILYPAHTVQRVLLGFLYQKSTCKRELVAYTTHLSKLLNHTLIGFIPKKSWNSNDATWFNEWREQPITAYETIFDPTQLANVIYGFLSSQYVPMVYPPLVSWKHEVMYKRGYGAVSDCCETALRNLCNHLAYNPYTNQFDYKKFSENSPLYLFYKLYTTAQYQIINSTELHEAWLQLVSGIPNVHYRKKNYEIEPSLKNFNRVLSYLMNKKHEVSVHNEETGCADEQQFIKLLESSGGIIQNSVCLRRYDDNDMAFSFDLNVSFTNAYWSGIRQKISLSIEPEHAWLCQTGAAFNFDNLKRMNTNVEERTQEWQLMTTAHASQCEIKKDIALLYAPSISPESFKNTLFEQMVLFSHPTITATQQYTLCRRLFNSMQHYNKNSFFEQAALRVINLLQNSALKQSALRMCIEKKMHLYTPKFAQMLYNNWKELTLCDQQNIVSALAWNQGLANNTYVSLCTSCLSYNDHTANTNVFPIDNRIALLLTLLRFKVDENPHIEKAMLSAVGHLTVVQQQTLRRKYQWLCKQGIIT